MTGEKETELGIDEVLKVALGVLLRAAHPCAGLEGQQEGVGASTKAPWGNASQHLSPQGEKTKAAQPPPAAQGTRPPGPGSSGHLPSPCSQEQGLPGPGPTPTGTAESRHAPGPRTPGKLLLTRWQRNG